MDNLNPENLTPAESIKKAEEMGGLPVELMTDFIFNPKVNDNVISLIKQKDGNWKAYGQKHGKMIELRGVKPEDVLGEFLTHE